MKGKVAETSQFVYLEIGQAKDIGSELKCDLKLLMLDYRTANLEIKYVARRLFVVLTVPGRRFREKKVLLIFIRK